MVREEARAQSRSHTLSALSSDAETRRRPSGGHRARGHPGCVAPAAATITDGRNPLLPTATAAERAPGRARRARRDRSPAAHPPARAQAARRLRARAGHARRRRRTARGLAGVVGVDLLRGPRTHRGGPGRRRAARAGGCVAGVETLQLRWRVRRPRSRYARSTSGVAGLDDLGCAAVDRGDDAAALGAEPQPGMGDGVREVVHDSARYGPAFWSSSASWPSNGLFPQPGLATRAKMPSISTVKRSRLSASVKPRWRCSAVLGEHGQPRRGVAGAA